MQNLFSAAEGSAQAAVKFDGTSSDNWYALASVYQLASGSSEDGAKNAEMALREAIARNPKSPLLQLSLATLALGKGDTKGAQDYIDKALSLKADYLDAFVLRSQIASKAGDNSSARDVLRSYVQIAPNDPLGLAYYAVAERTLGNYGTALTAIQRAHSLDPYTPEYHALYIALLYQTGDSETAQKEEALFKQYFPGYVSMLDSAKQTKQVPLPDATTKPKTSE